MALTLAQKQIIKADLDADVTLSAFPNTPDGNFEIAKAYNLASNPAFIVWKTSVQPEEYRMGLVWTEIDGLTTGKARIWDWITASMTAPFNAADSNIRQGIADAFAANTTTRANLLATAKRTATRAEKLLATGTGSDGSPGTLVFEGKLTHDDIAEVRAV